MATKLHLTICARSIPPVYMDFHMSIILTLQKKPKEKEMLTGIISLL